jgi:cyclophilin family peptidyl-prolyl cis-trans isomerase
MTWLRSLIPALLFAACPVQAQESFLPLTGPVELAEGQSEVETGELIFRGGVEIAPDKAGIGGISGLAWHEGNLHAVTDDGRWLVLKPEDVGNRLVDISGVTVHDLRDDRRAKLGSKERGDAEAITRLPSGEWLIAFEQAHRIWRYAEPGGAAAGAETRAATLLAGAEANHGLETLAAYDGGILACGEWVDPARPNCARLTESGAPSFHLPAPAGIAEVGGVPTDATCKPDGTCYVLFRSFNPGEGSRAAIVELPLSGESTTLAVLAPPLTLDNFEGLAVREAQGRAFLYLASDDNFRNCETKPGDGCQRTLVMKFEIKRAPVAAVEAPAPEAFARAPTARPGTRPFPQAASTSVVLTTSLGAITIALETGRAPVTAGNFLRYVDEKRFDGTTFYRAVHLPGDVQPNGLLQGGTRNDPKRIRPPIAHEPTNETGLTHTHGSVSMAMNAPGTADGDFFIMVEDQTGFDADPKASDPAWRAGFPAFGYVTSGMEVVAAIHAAARDPDAGEGVMKGEMLAEPVKIISARRVSP